MKKILFFLLAFAVCIFIVGCQDTENSKERIESEETNESKETEELEVAKEKLFDIYYIFEAPKATEQHDLSEVIKVVFNSNINDIDMPIAINIQENEIYINPRISSRGVRVRNGAKRINDIEKVIEIFEKYNIQEWKEDYSVEDPSDYEDGASWSLLLQYQDGSLRKYSGAGSESKGITPDNFDDFAKELNDFVNERLDDN
ncbi:hypothetical protein HXA35_14525 [Bacillus sp. A301a_S52]|nr:hypothetical protein [Bacillus sp. A301a_S52]